MKLLVLPEETEKLPLMVRDENYLIRNISAPVPNAMQRSDFDRGEIMIVSHPGWRRCGMDSRSSLSISCFSKELLKILEGYRYLRNLDCRENLLLRDQIVKLAFIELGVMKYFYEELKVENALDFAFERKLPVVMTIPCEFESHCRYSALEHLTNKFASYINYRIMNGQSIYVLPTYPSEGKIIGDDGERFEDSLDFPASSKGKSLFGKLLEYPWNKIYFAGGQINSCLRTTLGYFFKKENINIVDNFCFGSDDTKYPEISEDLEYLCSRKVVYLANPRKEKRIRNVLLKVLDSCYSIEHRWDEYASIFNVFNIYGLRKDNSQNNPNSQVRVCTFN